MIVGDVLISFGGHATESPDDLLDLLTGARIARRLLPDPPRRGGRDIQIVVAERPRP